LRKQEQEQEQEIGMEAMIRWNQESKDAKGRKSILFPFFLILVATFVHHVSAATLSADGPLEQKNTLSLTTKAGYIYFYNPYDSGGNCTITVNGTSTACVGDNSPALANAIYVNAGVQQITIVSNLYIGHGYSGVVRRTENGLYPQDLITITYPARSTCSISYEPNPRFNIFPDEDAISVSIVTGVSAGSASTISVIPGSKLDNAGTLKNESGEQILYILNTTAGKIPLPEDGQWLLPSGLVEIIFYPEQERFKSGNYTGTASIILSCE
jgi:hypothetical protein